MNHTQNTTRKDAYMASENETVADIIAEMRSSANADEYTPDGILGQTLNCLAGRLEAALKREMEAVGDVRKLGAALLEIRDAMRVYMSVGGISARRTIETAFEIARDALAAPARICDVLGEEAMINIVKSEIGKRVPKATDHEREIAEMAATAALATAYATAFKASRKSPILEAFGFGVCMGAKHAGEA